MKRLLPKIKSMNGPTRGLANINGVGGPTHGSAPTNMVLLVCSMVLLASAAFADMSNASYTITRSAVMSGGGTGSNGSVSDQYIVQADTVGDVAIGPSANGAYTLAGGFLARRKIQAEDVMRINVRGAISDPEATLYVNEICAINKGETWIAPFVTVTEGENTLNIHAYDTEGNVSEQVVTVIVDTRPPAQPHAAAASPTANPNPLITGEKEPDTELWVRIGSTETLIPGFFELENWSYSALLSEGQNSLAFFLTDPAGNKSTAFPLEIILDTDTDMFQIISPSEGAVTQSATVDITGRVLDSTATITVEGQPVTYFTNGAYFRRDNVLLDEMGPNTIQIHAESITGFTQDETLTVIRDSAALFPPTLTPPLPYAASTQIDIGGNCDVDTDVAVLLDGLEQSVASCADGTWQAAVTLSVGDNLISVEGRDAPDGIISGEAASVFVDVTAPSTPTVSDGGATQSSTTDITVNWFAYDGETSITASEYAVGTDDVPDPGIVYDSADVSGTLTIVGEFLLDTTYHVYVKVRNEAGNWSEVGISDGILISDNTIPTVLTLLPELGEFRYPGESINWQLVVHDPDEDTLEYSYALNGLTAFAFSEMAERTYTVPAGAFGRQEVSGQVRDDADAAYQEWPTGNTSFYAAHKPVDLGS